MHINNFFETLSKTLWSIEKHPFRKVGELQKGVSRQLSYDPSRVFKNDDQQNHFENDPEYLQFMRQQRLNNIILEKNRLVEQIKEKQQKIKVKQSQIVKSKFSMYNPFLHERQKCIACSECMQYEGNFRMNKIRNIGLFECMNCGCPMNAHREIVKDRLFSQLLYNNLKGKDLDDDTLESPIFLGALSFKNVPINLSLNKLMNILGEGGYTVISYESMKTHQFKQKMIEQKLFSKKLKFSSLDKFESLLNFVKFIHNNTQNPEQYLNQIKQEQISSQIKQYKELALEIQEDLNIDGEDVLCLLLQCYHNKRHNYSKFMATVKDFIKNVEPFYYSIDSYTSLIDSQIFFPSYFQINYEAYIPMSNNSKSSYSLKDTLDLNEYIIIKDGIDNVKRFDVQKAFRGTNQSHLIDYMLGTSAASQIVPYLDLKIVARVGTPQLTVVGELPPFVRFQQTNVIQSIMKNLCGKLLDSQRCAIVFRPALASSGIDNLIINFLRVNDFNIIGRTSVSMSPSQVRMMEIFENIAPQDSVSYHEMMKGLVQIVLVSKRRAIMQTKIISQGCSYGIKRFKARIIRQQPQFHLEINDKQYIQELQLFEPQFWQQSQLHIFNGVKNLFSLQNLIFGAPSKHQSLQLVEARTGNVIRQNSEDHHRKKINPKLKQAILQELNTQTFNFWMYTSASETMTEEIVNQFMPECAAYQSICLIIKPGYGHLVNGIKEALQQLKYKIIFSKSLILSRILSKQVVQSLLILKNPQLVKNLSAKYGSEKIQILCVAKESARRQILYFLRNFTLESKLNVPEGSIITDDILQQVLVPVWQQEGLILSIFHPVLQNIERSLIKLNKLERNDMFNLLIYLVGSIVGQEVKELPLRTQIGQLSYSVVDNPQHPKIQSWYYSLINRTSPLHVPLLFQYRHFNKLTFVLQTTIGQQLFKFIFRSYVQNKNTMTKGGRSLVLFIWAKKLADMIGELSETKPELNGYGLITKFGDVFRGEVTDDTFKNHQIQRVEQLILKWSQRDQEVVYHLERTLEKRGFKDRCKLKHKRLLPRVEEGNLRAVKSSRLSKLVLKDEIQMIDPNNQLTKEAELLTINLNNVLPEQMPKYWLWCQIYVNILRYSQPESRFKEPAEQFLELFIQVSSKQLFEDLEMLAIELYLEIVTKYEEGSTFLYPMVKLGLLDFKRLGKLNDLDETSGKKRKFIPKRGQNQDDTPEKPHLLQTMNKFNEYVYDVYGDAPKPDEKSLFRKNDPLHQGWVKQKRMVNLIREPSSQKQPRKGVYVEFEKKLDENEEHLKRKIEEQAKKYTFENNKILYDEEANNKNIWYRNKHESTYKPKAKMDQAIERQLIKLMQFKEENK